MWLMLRDGQFYVLRNSYSHHMLGYFNPTRLGIWPMESDPPFPGSSSYLLDEVRFLRNGITGVPVLCHQRKHAYPAGTCIHRLCPCDQHADLAGYAGEILFRNGPYRSQHPIYGCPWSRKEFADTSGQSAGRAAKAPCRLCSCVRPSSRRPVRMPAL